MQYMRLQKQKEKEGQEKNSQEEKEVILRPMFLSGRGGK